MHVCSFQMDKAINCHLGDDKGTKRSRFSMALTSVATTRPSGAPLKRPGLHSPNSEDSLTACTPRNTTRDSLDFPKIRATRASNTAKVTSLKVSLKKEDENDNQPASRKARLQPNTGPNSSQQVEKYGGQKKLNGLLPNGMISRIICFDNRDERPARRQKDKLAAIRTVWDK
ncbi:unnamed protein product [Pleuronectes platessa]|uniref:Uncharacterized protein n=1 Tax=Pleuronectes platessa TaxID=8262 RepID=A0A9N7TMZ0_PLEPL|nr:unnamed protein product [Pleuronectes platessa]